MNASSLLGSILPFVLTMQNMPEYVDTTIPKSGRSKLKKGLSYKRISYGGTYKKPEAENIGRNEPCHCGSKKKYKKCCMKKTS